MNKLILNDKANFQVGPEQNRFKTNSLFCKALCNFINLK